MKWHILLALAVGLMAAADGFGVPDWQPKKKKVRDDREQIQGTWTATFWESGGNKMQGTLELVLRRTRWVLTINKKDVIKGTIKMDPTKKPKTFDASVTEGAGTGVTVPGIYRLEGDTWSVCWTLTEPRPTEFGTQGDLNRFLFILKRARR